MNFGLSDSLTARGSLLQGLPAVSAEIRFLRSSMLILALAGALGVESARTVTVRLPEASSSSPMTTT